MVLQLQIGVLRLPLGLHGVRVPVVVRVHLLLEAGEIRVVLGEARGAELGRRRVLRGPMRVLGVRDSRVDGMFDWC